MKTYVSLGAGVQSSTLALMAAVGEITPMPEGAIFADTQAEPSAVYRWLDYLEAVLPFPVHRVTAGDLRVAALETRVSRKGGIYYKVALPVHTADADGGKGQVSRRGCTYRYKIRPIERALRRLAGVKRGEKSPVAESWIGISLDEMQRMKRSRMPWIATRWPLIERRMTRAGCLAWLERNGHPTPPRSACTFCPFRSDREWRHLRRDDPAGFADAVAFDAEIRAARPGSSVAYLHASLVPLGEVDLRNDTDRGQLTLWADECTGMCGV